MARTGWIYSDRFLEHDTGSGHPERPERLKAICAAMHKRGLMDRVDAVPFEPAAREWVEAVHAPEYVDRLQRYCAAGRSHIDCLDSAICPASFDIALLAAGGALAACDAVLAGRIDHAFCAVRPPGHHAERDVSMGFCLLNNVAIAARYLQRRHGITRVFIFDWDVHHGNGTQHLFEDDGTVFYASIHEDPRYLYPGTGYAHERGRGAGTGATLNLPMMPGAADADYRRAMEESILPAARAFRPDFVLISAGFDAHARDPLAHIELSDAGFNFMGEAMLELAGSACAGRLVALLEGGYDLAALSANVADFVERMADR